MSDLKPGIHKATVNDVDRIGVLDSTGDFNFVNDDGLFCCVSNRRAVDVRPAIVLDLDSDGLLDAARRIGEMSGAMCHPVGSRLREISDQIEAQVKPPKPDEPQRIGAVVEDIKGDLWVRASAAEDGPWVTEGRGALWIAVDAVKVLSEGVVLP